MELGWLSSGSLYTVDMLFINRGYGESVVNVLSTYIWCATMEEKTVAGCDYLITDDWVQALQVSHSLRILG